MKLKFEANLEYQMDAVQAVTDLFEGLPPKQDGYEITLSPFERQLSFAGLGINNDMMLGTDQLLKNLQTVQERIIIPKSLSLLTYNDIYPFPNFSVEMETGTGKTYVYLRTIFELNRKYGFSKFIIVVPSVAIREGVLSSLELMGEHFKGLYDNVPFDYFVYSSADRSKVRQFAVSNEIQIMIINIQAFQKDINIINQEQDRMSGRRPIEFVQATNPIVIIDEPQSVDSTEKSQAAIKNLNPLFCLRYSATHVNPYNVVYKLDPIRAYDLRLVKQIEVSSIRSENNFNDAFIRIDSIGWGGGKRKRPMGRLQFWKIQRQGRKRKKSP